MMAESVAFGSQKSAGESTYMVSRMKPAMSNAVSWALGATMPCILTLVTAQNVEDTVRGIAEAEEAPKLPEAEEALPAEA